MDAVDGPMGASGTGADHIALAGDARLQQASAPYLEFQGLSARECEAFIAAVSRRAFTEGKEYDDRWTAAFASSCFAYDALRWWNGLDEKVQGSWKLLRSAMLSNYQPISREATGLAAPSKARGRVRVISWGPSRIFYLSKNLSSVGRFGTSTSADDALIVSYDTSRGAQAVLIAGDQTREYDLLCVGWHSRDMSWAHNWSWLGAMNSSTRKTSFSPSHLEGPSVTMWNLERHPTSRGWRLTLSDPQYQGVVFAGSRGEGSEIWFQPEPTHLNDTTDLFIEPI